MALLLLALPGLSMTFSHYFMMLWAIEDPVVLFPTRESSELDSRGFGLQFRLSQGMTIVDM